MEYVYEVRVLKRGESINPAEGELWVGSSLQADPDGKGEFSIAIHLLVPKLAVERGN